MLSVDKINELQQQADQWKKEYEILDSIIDIKDKLIAGLKDEQKRLKAENERLKEKIESYVCSQNCYAYKQTDKYRHILQEIKTITEKYDAEAGDTIIANPIQDCYDIYRLTTKVESEE